MIKFLVLLLSLLSLNVYADKILCVGEAGAGVIEGVENKPYTPIVADVYKASTQRYMLSNDTGSWMVKAIGKDAFQLACENEYLCNLPGATVRSFTRSVKTGNFTLIESVLSDTKAVLSTLVIKGRCTKW
jgi:hypothetical protein